MDYDIKPSLMNEKTSSSLEVFSADNKYDKKSLTCRQKIILMILFILAGAIVIIIWVGLTFLPPKKFKPPVSVDISSGLSVKQTGQILKDKKIIKNSAFFQLCIRFVSKKNSIQLGQYLFEEPEHVCRVAYRMSRGSYGNAQKKVTIPEGSTNAEIADIFASKYSDFNKTDFLKLAKPLQGKLFPETYFFFSTVTPEQVIRELSDIYTTKTQNIFPENFDPKKQLEIITMASILEREANNPQEAKIISGILWKRIQIGMPLQVDATLKYTTGRGSDELTLDDLKKDGPYNTYTRTGLPPGPIGNPGIAMIESAMNPVESPYLYYLHDAQGNIYYGKTHDEHVRNKQKYLK